MCSQRKLKTQSLTPKLEAQAPPKASPKLATTLGPLGRSSVNMEVWLTGPGMEALHGLLDVHHLLLQAWSKPPQQHQRKKGGASLYTLNPKSFGTSDTDLRKP